MTSFTQVHIIVDSLYSVWKGENKSSYFSIIGLKCLIIFILLMKERIVHNCVFTLMAHLHILERMCTVTFPQIMSYLS